MSPSPHDLAGAGVLTTAFLLILALAELWSRRGHGAPEHTRKLVHLLGGAVCLAFPFLIESPWVVLGMAGALSLLFAVGIRSGRLHSLCRVQRRSRGSEYYPLAIFLLFVITRHRPDIYIASVLVLAVADAFAALIGTRYGRIRFRIETDTKSLEGSLAFALIAWIAMAVPLLVATDLDPAVSILATLLVATLVTGFEAIALEGSDNLFVPLAAAVILQKITTKPLTEILYQNLSLLAISAGVAFAISRCPSFNVAGAIVYGLFAYGAWSLGSELWALPALIGFVTYLVAKGRLPVAALTPGNPPPLSVRVTFHALVIPLLFLVVGNMLALQTQCYTPFIATLAAVLAFSVGSLGQHRPTPAGAALTGAGAGLLLAVPPWLLLARPAPAVLLAILLLTAAVAAIEAPLAPQRHPTPGTPAVWTAPRLLLAFTAGTVLFTLHITRLLPPWQPF